MRMTWVFKIKTLDTGALDKFKARFCVFGTNQVKGQDYFKSFASGARGTSVKSVVIITVVEGWIDFHFDLNGAYLDFDIDTDVYDQPAGLDPVVGPNGEKMCMKLDKAIYGTVQAARLFTKKFRAALVTIGFEVSLDDEAVYRLDHKLGRIVLATHVDDGIGGASIAAVRDWMYAEIIKHGFSFSQQRGGCTRSSALAPLAILSTARSPSARVGTFAISFARTWPMKWLPHSTPQRRPHGQSWTCSQLVKKRLPKPRCTSLGVPMPARSKAP